MCAYEKVCAYKKGALNNPSLRINDSVMGSENKTFYRQSMISDIIFKLSGFGSRDRKLDVLMLSPKQDLQNWTYLIL